MPQQFVELNDKYRAFTDTLESMEDCSTPEEIAEVKRLLDGIEVAMEEKILSIARYRKTLQDQAKMVIGEEIRRLQTRKKQQENKAESIGKYLHWALGELPGKKVKSALGALSLQSSPPALQIIDSDLIPDEYWDRHDTLTNGRTVELSGVFRVYVGEGAVSLFTLNKQAIMDEYKAGKEIAGTKVTQGTHVRFR